MEPGARRLELTSSSVSRYCKGVDQPTKQTLRLFKIILSSEQPDILGPANMALREVTGPQPADWERKLLDGLRPLHIEDRNRIIKAINALIDGLPQRQPISYRSQKPVSSSAPSDAQVLADRAGAPKGGKR